MRIIKCLDHQGALCSLLIIKPRWLWLSWDAPCWESISSRRSTDRWSFCPGVEVSAGRQTHGFSWRVFPDAAALALTQDLAAEDGGSCDVGDVRTEGGRQVFGQRVTGRLQEKEGFRRSLTDKHCAEALFVEELVYQWRPRQSLQIPFLKPPSTFSLHAIWNNNPRAKRKASCR